MVRAMVTRETNGSYTVTFGDAYTPLINQKIVNVPVVSSGTSHSLEDAKAAWKTVVHQVHLGIQAISIYAAYETQAYETQAYERHKTQAHIIDTDLYRMTCSTKRYAIQRSLL